MRMSTDTQVVPGPAGLVRLRNPSLIRQSRNQTGREFDAETRRRGEKNAEHEGRSGQDRAETAEKRALTPREFPGKLAPISACSGRHARIGRGRWAWKYSASRLQNSTMQVLTVGARIGERFTVSEPCHAVAARICAGASGAARAGWGG